MIIGHLPAGYLAASLAARWNTSRLLFVGILIGAVLPDIDILWFYLIDNRSTHHHHYITHRPLLWLGLLMAGLTFNKRLLLGLGAGGLLHVSLDTLLGQIGWLWPFSNAYTTLIVVPATHDFWLLSFLNHWTFKIEIALALTALFVFWRKHKSRG